jgi:hypothetical protein
MKYMQGTNRADRDINLTSALAPGYYSRSLEYLFSSPLAETIKGY